MAQFRDVIKHKKECRCLGALAFTFILVEVLIFNGRYLFSNSARLEERRLSINEGTLHQFNIENGSLVAQNNDPNFTFTIGIFLDLLETSSRLDSFDFFPVDFYDTARNELEFIISLERLPQVLSLEEKLAKQLD